MSLAAIMKATSADDYAAGKTLIEEYAATSGVDLCVQNFSEEMASLPGIYGPPRGCLLLARINGEWVGCVTVRNQDAESCEMKRLYVKTHYRGLGLGRRLAELAIRCAQKLGYSRILLDTLPSMAEARSLYHSLEFRDVEAYHPNPVEGVRHLALALSHND